jgi:hypothetical protein
MEVPCLFSEDTRSDGDVIDDDFYHFLSRLEFSDVNAAKRDNLSTAIQHSSPLHFIEHCTKVGTEGDALESYPLRSLQTDHGAARRGDRVRKQNRINQARYRERCKVRDRLIAGFVCRSAWQFEKRLDLQKELALLEEAISRKRVQLKYSHSKLNSLTKEKEHICARFKAQTGALPSPRTVHGIHLTECINRECRDLFRHLNRSEIFACDQSAFPPPISAFKRQICLSPQLLLDGFNDARAIQDCSLSSYIQKYQRSLAAESGVEVSEVCWFIVLPLEVAAGVSLSASSSFNSPKCWAAFVIFMFSVILESSIISRSLQPRKYSHDQLRARDCTRTGKESAHARRDNQQSPLPPFPPHLARLQRLADVLRVPCTNVLRVPCTNVLRVPCTNVLRVPCTNVLRVPCTNVLRVPCTNAQSCSISTAVAATIPKMLHNYRDCLSTETWLELCHQFLAFLFGKSGVLSDDENRAQTDSLVERILGGEDVGWEAMEPSLAAISLSFAEAVRAEIYLVEHARRDDCGSPVSQSTTPDLARGPHIGTTIKGEDGKDGAIRRCGCDLATCGPQETSLVRSGRRGGDCGTGSMSRRGISSSSQDEGTCEWLRGAGAEEDGAIAPGDASTGLSLDGLGSTDRKVWLSAYLFLLTRRVEIFIHINDCICIIGNEGLCLHGHRWRVSDLPAGEITNKVVQPDAAQGHCV